MVITGKGPYSYKANLSLPGHRASLLPWIRLQTAPPQTIRAGYGGKKGETWTVKICEANSSKNNHTKI